MFIGYLFLLWYPLLEVATFYTQKCISNIMVRYLIGFFEMMTIYKKYNFAIKSFFYFLSIVSSLSECVMIVFGQERVWWIVRYTHVRTLSTIWIISLVIATVIVLFDPSIHCTINVQFSGIIFVTVPVMNSIHRVLDSISEIWVCIM